MYMHPALTIEYPCEQKNIIKAEQRNIFFKKIIFKI